MDNINKILVITFLELMFTFPIKGCNSKDRFECFNGDCIPSSWVCDGMKDCEAGNDELDCYASPELLGQPTTQSSDQSTTSFLAEQPLSTIQMEQSAEQPTTGCHSKDRFMCLDGRCIPSSWLCDGMKDCEACNDELNCYASTELIGQSTTSLLAEQPLSSEQTKQSTEQPTADSGGWSGWSNYSSCSASCGDGRQTRWRSCDNPKPSYGGLNCYGSPTESRTCTQRSCPVDGNWSNWSAYGPCTVSCNRGMQVRTRTCLNPAPSLGGKDCIVSDTDRIVCSDNPCPIDGAWSSWGNFSVCSKAYGVGIRFRIRNCSEPQPQFGGNFCAGDKKDVELCQEKECPVWSLWTDGKCSVSCGEGTRNRSRVCQVDGQPADSRDCTGAEFEFASCNITLCPAFTPVIPKFAAGAGINVLAVSAFVVGVVLVVVVIVVAAVGVVCWKRRKGRNLDNNQRRDDSSEKGVVVHENPTYAEPGTDDHIYTDIPSVTSAENDASNSEIHQIRNTRSPYEMLPRMFLGDVGENINTKISTDEGNNQHVFRPEVPTRSIESYNDKTDSILRPINELRGLKSYQCSPVDEYITPMFENTSHASVAPSFERHLDVDDYLEPISKTNND